MPLFYETCLARDLLYIKCFDYLTFDETVRVFAQLTRDPNHRVGRTELIDLTDLVDSDFTFALTQTAVRMVQTRGTTPRVSLRRVILAPDDTHYGMARMFETLCDLSNGGKVEVYRHEGEALASLALPYGTVAAFRDAERLEPAVPLAPQSFMDPQDAANLDVTIQGADQAS